MNKSVITGIYPDTWCRQVHVCLLRAEVSESRCWNDAVLSPESSTTKLKTAPQDYAMQIAFSTDFMGMFAPHLICIVTFVKLMQKNNEKQ